MPDATAMATAQGKDNNNNNEEEEKEDRQLMSADKKQVEKQ